MNRRSSARPARRGIRRGAVPRLTSLLAALASPLLAAGAYEEPPILLSAADTVPAELLRGEHHTVADRVENDGFMNHYRIESDFGTFEAEGNVELRERVREILAISQLEEVTRSEAFANAMKDSVTRSYKAAEKVVKDPVGTAKGLPGGIKRFAKRTARKAKDLGDTVNEQYQNQKENKKEKEASGEEPDGESGLTKEEAQQYAAKGAEVGEEYAENWLGYTAARRQWAQEMEVDPYTDNEILNKELLRVSQAATAGGLVVKFSPVPKLGIVGDVASVSQLVYGMDPLDLRLRNEKILAGMGVSDEAVEALYDNRFGTPTTSTILVDALSRMDGVEHRERFVEQGGLAQSKAELGLLVRSALFLADYHTATRPLARVGEWNHFPHALADDGRLVVVVAVDDLRWTQELAELVEAVTPNLAQRSGTRTWEVWIEGGCSELARERLTASGYEVFTDAASRMK